MRYFTGLLLASCLCDSGGMRVLGEPASQIFDLRRPCRKTRSALAFTMVRSGFVRDTPHPDRAAVGEGQSKVIDIATMTGDLSNKLRTSIGQLAGRALCLASG
jgi:hypothetical protein